MFCVPLLLGQRRGEGHHQPPHVNLLGADRLADRLYIVYRRSPLGPVDPSFRALSGRLTFTVRRNKFNQDSLSP